MNAVREVVEHHRSLQAWLNGTSTDLGRILDMHTPDFTWYDPDGTLLTLPDFRAAMEEAHGTARGLRIRIAEPRVLLEADGLTVISYEEHQPGSVRRAVAVMVPSPGTRNGLLWRSLHETWLQPPE